MKPELKEKLQTFIDELEQEYGDLEGFEVKLKHPIKGGEKQNYADIERFTVYYLHKENLIDK